jgi:hypothetical protein
MPSSKIDWNEATDIVTKNLTKSLIDLRGFGLASKAIAELGFDHAEGSFDVAALVILLHKPSLVEFVVVVHLTPEGRSCASRYSFDSASASSPVLSLLRALLRYSP